MGDKTQLLAMVFAPRHKASVVLWGVFVATALNHMLAVAVGIEVVSLLAITAIGWLLARSTQEIIEPEPEEG